MTAPPQPASRAALIAGAACYAYWGVVALVFQAMSRFGATPWEIIGHRTFWSVFWAGGLVLLAGQRREALQVLRSPRILAWLVLSTLLISLNWSLFVWTVIHGGTLEVSLGYYITPLISMAAGALVFRERLDRIALAAIALAGAGVVLQTAALGHPPWASLLLALSFGAYGVVRKRVKAEAQTGLFVEGLIMTVPGGLYLLWLQGSGQGHFLTSPGAAVLLFLAGPLTVVPLALFSWAARRMPLSTMGFLQFLSPTLSFLIGAAEGEALGPLRLASFGLIWVGIAVFAWGAWRALRRAKQLAAQAQAEAVGQRVAG